MPGPLFDPDTGKVIDPEALKSVTLAGAIRPDQASKKITVDGESKQLTTYTHQGDGGVAGQSLEHGDGHVDSHVMPRAAKGTLRSDGGS